MAQKNAIEETDDTLQILEGRIRAERQFILDTVELVLFKLKAGDTESAIARLEELIK